MTDFSWNGGDDDWVDSGNWTPTGVPSDNTATASIGAPGKYTVEVYIDRRLFNFINQVDVFHLRIFNQAFIYMHNFGIDIKNLQVEFHFGRFDLFNIHQLI